ncbi:MAG: DUF2304 family protein [Bdellovibrionota bacterium]
MFPFLFAAFLLALIILDYACLPKSARRAWAVLAITFVAAAIFAVYQQPLDYLPRLLGVGRPVDAVIYVVTAVLVRELFLSRIRHRALQAQITELVRQRALDQAKRL